MESQQDQAVERIISIIQFYFSKTLSEDELKDIIGECEEYESTYCRTL